MGESDRSCWHQELGKCYHGENRGQDCHGRCALYLSKRKTMFGFMVGIGEALLNNKHEDDKKKQEQKDQEAQQKLI